MMLYTFISQWLFHLKSAEANSPQNCINVQLLRECTVHASNAWNHTNLLEWKNSESDLGIGPSVWPSSLPELSCSYTKHMSALTSCKISQLLAKTPQYSVCSFTTAKEMTNEFKTLPQRLLFRTSFMSSAWNMIAGIKLKQISGYQRNILGKDPLVIYEQHGIKLNSN